MISAVWNDNFGNSLSVVFEWFANLLDNIVHLFKNFIYLF